jgi:UDP-N-acetylmuramate dehydrogenase
MNLKSDFCLKPFNTFGIEVLARQCAQITNCNDLSELFKNGSFKQSFLVIGEASNILFLSHFEGIVIMPLLRGKEIIEETEYEVVLKIKSGEYWSSLVDYAVENGWWGIENLSMIPGKVGAAPIQNIGAYGTELKDVFISLEAFDTKTGELKTFNKNDCEFGYRDSVFKTLHKGRFVVCSITIKLSKTAKPNLSYNALSGFFTGTDKATIKLKMIRDAVNQIRSSKLPDPQIIKNGGSFFKNPIVETSIAEELKQKYPEMPVYSIDSIKSKIAAGWLIEQCGWKGKRIGDAAVHEKQALVLVNLGKAKGGDILHLSEKIAESVFKTFNIKLEKEIQVV